MSRSELAKIPTETLEKEVTKRKDVIRKRNIKYGKQALKVVMHKCPGCGVDYSTRDMIKHPCPSGTSYYLRLGRVWDNKKKRYVLPEDLSK
jgi:hypothetical protein